MNSSMMKKDKSRIQLRKYEGKKKKFRATMKKYGSLKGTKVGENNKDCKKLLLENIKLISKNKKKQILCDHIWIDLENNLLRDLNPCYYSPIISFEAKVISYIKFSKKNSRIVSWKISDIQNIKFLEVNEQQKQRLITTGRKDLLL